MKIIKVEKCGECGFIGRTHPPAMPGLPISICRHPNAPIDKLLGYCRVGPETIRPDCPLEDAPDSVYDFGWQVELTEVGGGASGLCLGLTGCRQEIHWTTPNKALRFARREDAEAFGKAFAPTLDFIITEHGWEKGGNNG